MVAFSIAVAGLLGNGHRHSAREYRNIQLRIAAKNGNERLVQSLLAQGAEISSGEALSGLQSAVKNGHLGVIRILFDHHIPANDSETNLIALALSRRHIAIAAFLFENDLPVNCDHIENWAELRTQSLLSVIHALQSAGCDLHSSKSPIGQTLLSQAVVHGNYPLVDFLFSLRRNVSWTNQHSQTLLHLIALFNKPQNGHDILQTVRIVDRLLNEGLPIDVETLGGQTPFLYAANNCNLPLILYLRKRGANTQHRDKEGHNALDLYLNQRQFLDGCQDPEIERLLRNIMKGDGA